ncbi:MAG: RCC1 domain-containing protein, partial [Gemmatimonadaceae bacterium]
MFCWGLNSTWWEYGAPPDLVPGTGTPAAPIVEEIVSLAGGVGAHFCGITRAQGAICWGRGGFGQLGTGAVGAIGNSAAVVQGDIPWADISVSRISTCGLSTLGNGYCWGTNQSGEVGSPSIAIGDLTLAPNAIHGGYVFKSLAAGWLHACAIAASGAAYCWGNNAQGQLGIGTADTTRRQEPRQVMSVLSFKQISVGSRYTCALTTDGDAYCWGANRTGQLGDGTLVDRNLPTLVAGGLKFVEIVTSSGFATGAFATAPSEVQGGVGHTCALTMAGKAYCWGWNGNGELGDGTTDDKTTPTPVAGDLT